ncbi:MAG: hypothetical protein M3N41_10745 [Acidobacteriota bacterium]|nr:hypothetical protein [Acidobacteriota bacterium]
MAALVGTAAAQNSPSPTPRTGLPRTADGKPNLAGIWQVSDSAPAGDLRDHAARYDMRAGQSVVVGGEIPYQPQAAEKRAENFKNRRKADPLGQCFMPGVPRIMYLDSPFQIFQTPQAIAMTFEWSLVYRLIYTDGSSHPAGLDFWMGDSRGRWEGDALVVDVANHKDKTWFDLAGDFHSDALHVVERYRMTDSDTIEYEATIEDPKTFTKSWTIHVPLKRRTGLGDRILEYGCQSETEEANGAFQREERTWYSGSGTSPTPSSAAAPWPAPTRSPADSRPNLQGFYQSDGGGANYGLEKHATESHGFTPGGRGVIVDPPDGNLPMLPWAIKETIDRNLPERGYDDPTAHCFPAGIPRSMYVPSPLHIIQTSDYIVFLHERMAWRIVSLNRNTHLPDSIRLWQGDSIGRWEGNTLVVDTANFNGKTWLNEVGEIVSYAEHMVERFTQVNPDAINYEATVTDPLVYSRPWTIAFPLKTEKGGLLEVACHEDDQDLAHLKFIKDAAAAKKK